MKRDLVTKFDYSLGIAPANYTATTTGTARDMINALDIVAIFTLNDDTTVDATNFFTFSFTESATESGSYTAVPDAQFVTIDSWDKIWNASGEANAFHFGQVTLSAGMRWIKAVSTETAAAEGSFGVKLMWLDKTQPGSA